MKVIGLDHKQYSLSLNKKARNKVSSYHERARSVLNKIFKNDTIYEEVTLKGSKKFNQNDLYADFLIPSHRVIVECHGEQHYEQTPFFHGSKLDFLAGKKRDRRKEEWCQINSFVYIELPFGETNDEWRTRILCGIET